MVPKNKTSGIPMVVVPEPCLKNFERRISTLLGPLKQDRPTSSSCSTFCQSRGCFVPSGIFECEANRASWACPIHNAAAMRKWVGSRSARSPIVSSLCHKEQTVSLSNCPAPPENQPGTLAACGSSCRLLQVPQLPAAAAEPASSAPPTSQHSEFSIELNTSEHHFAIPGYVGMAQLFIHRPGNGQGHFDLLPFRASRFGQPTILDTQETHVSVDVAVFFGGVTNDWFDPPPHVSKTPDVRPAEASQSWPRWPLTLPAPLCIEALPGESPAPPILGFLL